MAQSHAGTPLSSLAAWSAQHIRYVFEAPSDELSRCAIDATFSPGLAGSINGAALDFNGLCQLVAAMRASVRGGLEVEWTHAEDVPDDALNRDGQLIGAYIIRGIWKRDQGSELLGEYERHKTVDVRIESQSSQLSLDSRLIVRLGVVAIDVPVDQRTSGRALTS
ncbi:hypothetical protein B0H15DRAFT_912490 [Mycena belliarum]|uniref:Uncharacterized protein n=1 Tax=Mycena belliarum TaxID=1033014 RepID=A0AAD6TWP1_9AGAR|nr:hypothetical protein B0H15DRAFT_912490 [Mycena belliae]